MTPEGPIPRPGPAADYFEFGPFRLEASPPSLYRGTEFVALTPKALDVLLVLVEDAGKVVTKDDLMQRVWRDAFVEEGSIANHISLLRKVLNPYLEDDGPIATVARRGYRFTAPVTLKNAKSQISLMTESGRLTPEAKEAIAVYVDAHPSQFEAPRAPGAPRAPRAPAVSIAVAVVLIIATIGIAMRMLPVSSEAAPPLVRRSVAVLPMKNLSGDREHDWLSVALAETISAELGGGQHLRIIAGESVVRMQQELSPPMGLGLTRKQLDDIGGDLACDLILSGNFLIIDGQIRVDLRLDEVATGEAIANASITDAKDKFLNVVSKAGKELRSALKSDRPAADADAMRAFAATPDALRSYFQGIEALRLRDGPRARDFLAASIAADDDFALAHAALSTTWRLLGYDRKGADEAKRALDLSARLSTEDRMAVEAQYHEATASWPKAIELYQQLWQSYPDNLEYGLKLGNAQWLGARAADTLKTVEEMRKLPERDSRDTRIDLLEASAADSAGDVPRAMAAATKAADKAIAGKANLMLARARIKQGIYASRVIKTDEAMKYFTEAESLFSSLHDTGGVADAIRWQGGAMFGAAKLDRSEALSLRALEMAQQIDYIRLVTEIQLSLADLARLKGDLAGSIRLAEQALAASREASNRSQEARALGTLGSSLRLRGDYTRARESFQQSADIAGAIGDVRNQNIAVNNSAVIDFLTGDLKSARAKYEKILVDDRRLGNSAATALRLNNISRILALQDELAEAEKLNVEECALQESLKNTVNLAWCRTRLADIWIELGRKGDAEQSSRQITLTDFGSAVVSPIYYSRFARLQLSLGHLAAAVEAIDAAERVQAKAGVVEEQAIHVAVIRAEVEAAQGKRAAAMARLHRAIADAEKRGLLNWSLDARMVLARLDPKESSALERDARTAGFLLLAGKARALVTTTTH